MELSSYSGERPAVALGSDLEQPGPFGGDHAPNSGSLPIGLTADDLQVLSSALAHLWCAWVFECSVHVLWWGFTCTNETHVSQNA